MAQDEARDLRHNHIGPEHLLRGLLREGTGVAAQVLADFGVTREKAERTEWTGPGKIPFTREAKQSLEQALRESLKLGHDFVGTEHILLGVAPHVGLDADAVREAVIAKLGGPAVFGSPKSK